jgi:hypothetical protein
LLFSPGTFLNFLMNVPNNFIWGTFFNFLVPHFRRGKVEERPRTSDKVVWNVAGAKVKERPWLK